MRLDSSLPLADVRLMDDVLERAQSRPRFLTLLLTLFSITALAIATVGIYGVVSYSVARRTKEFGLRMVLGAQTGDVLGLVMKQGAAMVGVGLVAGLVTAFAADAADGEFAVCDRADGCVDVCERNRGAGGGRVVGVLHPGPPRDRGRSDADAAVRMSGQLTSTARLKSKPSRGSPRAAATCRRRWRCRRS